MTDPYVYRGTDTLINRFGIRDPAELAKVEANRSALSIAQLVQRGLPGSYDLAHLQAFHREIFSAVYPWAGEIRTVAIAKTQLFALPQHIDSYASGVFAELRREDALQGLDQQRFIDRLTHYYAEVNAVHPFREGNGRAQRAFLGQLARDAGYEIRWGLLDADRNIEASIASLNGDNSKLQEMFAGLVQRQEPAPDEHHDIESSPELDAGPHICAPEMNVDMSGDSVRAYETIRMAPSSGGELEPVGNQIDQDLDQCAKLVAEVAALYQQSRQGARQVEHPPSEYGREPEHDHQPPGHGYE